MYVCTYPYSKSLKNEPYYAYVRMRIRRCTGNGTQTTNYLQFETFLYSDQIIIVIKYLLILLEKYNNSFIVNIFYQSMYVRSQS